MPALAYSYLRFSSPQQATGDSVRRQTESTADWCRRHKVSLDTSLNLRDEGVSAFRGKHRENPDVHGLAAFLSAVKTGRVEEGSYLIVENLDRLSRESIVPAVHLFTGILMSGVRIVQLRPAETIFDANADMTSVMLALVELSRGNSESRMKSERVGAAWANKRKHAATRIVTRRLPGWIRENEGKLELIPERAEVVRRVFALAREGSGVHRIAETLNADRVPVMGRTTFKGRAVRWNETVVYSILRSTATYGVYQPHTVRAGKRTPAGEPIPDYYPPVVTEDEYHAVRGILSNRAKVGRGRRGKHVNLFAGLLRDARTGGSLTAKHLGNRAPVLIPVGAKQGTGEPWVSFLLKPFEDSIRAELVEVQVKDIAPNGSADARVESLSGQLADLESLKAKWRTKMDNPALVDEVSAKLEELNTRGKALAAELAEARRDAANPLSESWGAARAAGKALADDDSDETRERYRAAVRRAVESIHVLIMPGEGPQGRAPIRVAAVQVWFKSGAHRDYLVGYRPARHRCPGAVLKPQSFAEMGVGEGLDLRKPEHVRRLETQLLAALRK